MKESRENRIRRYMIRGLLVMAVLLSMSALGDKGQSPASWRTFSLQAEAGSAASLLSKNNPLEVPVQDLPPAAVKNAEAEPLLPPVSGGQLMHPPPISRLLPYRKCPPLRANLIRMLSAARQQGSSILHSMTGQVQLLPGSSRYCRSRE